MPKVGYWGEMAPCGGKKPGNGIGLVPIGGPWLLKGFPKGPGHLATEFAIFGAQDTRLHHALGSMAHHRGARPTNSSNRTRMEIALHGALTHT